MENISHIFEEEIVHSILESINIIFITNIGHTPRENVRINVGVYISHSVGDGIGARIDEAVIRNIMIHNIWRSILKD